MPHKTPEAKSNKLAARDTRPEPSAGPHGVALAPPDYGIDFVDHPSADQSPIQRQAPKDGVSHFATGGSSPNYAGLPENLRRNIGKLSVSGRNNLRVHSPSSATARHIMPSAVQSKMEDAFNSDFSDVRIHPDSARVTGMGARALTEGNDIHFAPGAFQPTAENGQRMLGHELAHVVQQRSGRVRPTGKIGGQAYNDNPALEREADQSGELAARGQPAAVQGDGGDANNAPVQQYFWELTTLLTIAGEIGLSAMTVMGLVTAFGVIAVGYALMSCVNRGAKKVSREELEAEIRQREEGGSENDETEKLESVNKVAFEGKPLEVLPQLDMSVLLSAAPKQRIEGTPLQAPARLDMGQAPKMGAVKTGEMQQAPASTIKIDPIAMAASKRPNPEPQTDSPKKAPQDDKPKAPLSLQQEEPILSEAEERRIKDLKEIRLTASSLKNELEALNRTVKGPKIDRYLQQVNSVLNKDDQDALASRRIIGQISLAMVPFRDEDKRQKAFSLKQKEEENARQLKEAENEQRQIDAAARLIRTKHEDYKNQMALAVARFPDMAPLQLSFTNLLKSASSVPDRDLPEYDRDTIDPAWKEFTDQRTSNQTALDHQGGHRLFIHNTELVDILNRTQTIEQRLGNYLGGRDNPTRQTPALHERVTEGRAYNVNIIYTWQGNNLYLHGIVDWHLDASMSGGQKTQSVEIEDRGEAPGNFIEVRYDPTTGGYARI